MATEKCIHCAMDIPTEARYCPYCAKPVEAGLVIANGMIGIGGGLFLLALAYMFYAG